MMMDKRCPFCHGQGTIPDQNGVMSPRASCPICQGRGFNLVPRDADRCAFCRGTGKVESESGGEKICPDCGGIGYKW
jgi:DnaJ-class molecular chaperone